MLIEVTETRLRAALDQHVSSGGILIRGAYYHKINGKHCRCLIAAADVYRTTDLWSWPPLVESALVNGWDGDRLDPLDQDRWYDLGRRLAKAYKPVAVEELAK
jgi:hypothetical protein